MLVAKLDCAVKLELSVTIHSRGGCSDRIYFYVSFLRPRMGGGTFRSGAHFRLRLVREVVTTPNKRFVRSDLTEFSHFDVPTMRRPEKFLAELAWDTYEMYAGLALWHPVIEFIDVENRKSRFASSNRCQTNQI